MKSHTYTTPRRFGTALAAFIAGCLSLGLSSCASHKKPAPTPPPASEVETNCADENGKPDVRCAISPSATFDPNGRLWLVWSQAGRVYVSHSGDLGKSFSAPSTVNAVAEPVEANGEARPKIVVTKAGAVYVSWTKKLSQHHAGHIRFSRSLDGGKTFTQPVQVNSDSAEITHRFDSMAVNNRDYIYIAWIDGRDKAEAEQAGRPFDGASLYYSYSSDGGRSFHAEKKITDHVCECCRVILKIDPKQMPVVIWRHVFDGQIRDPALSQFAAKDKPGPVERISADNWKIDGCPHQGPALSIAPKGAYFMTWFTGAETHKGLFFSSSFDQGKTFSAPHPFGNPTQSSHPDILADEQSVHIVWKDSNGKNTILLEQNSWDAGQTWSKPRIVAETDNTSDHPFLLGFKGRHYVAWQTKAQGFQLIALDN